MPIVLGKTKFKTALTQHDVYQGQSTGKYAVQLELDDSAAKELSSMGVKIKEYEGTPIRKFTSRYEVPVYINANEQWDKELPNGTQVKLEYVTKKHPTAGEVPYMKRILILEMGKDDLSKGDSAFFEEEPPF